MRDRGRWVRSWLRRGLLAAALSVAVLVAKVAFGFCRIRARVPKGSLSEKDCVEAKQERAAAERAGTSAGCGLAPGSRPEGGAFLVLMAALACALARAFSPVTAANARGETVFPAYGARLKRGRMARLSSGHLAARSRQLRPTNGTSWSARTRALGTSPCCSCWGPVAALAARRSGASAAADPAPSRAPRCPSQPWGSKPRSVLAIGGANNRVQPSVR
jgi:hypothetical protein